MSEAAGEKSVSGTVFDGFAPGIVSDGPMPGTARDALALETTLRSLPVPDGLMPGLRGLVAWGLAGLGVAVIGGTVVMCGTAVRVNDSKAGLGKCWTA